MHHNLKICGLQLKRFSSPTIQGPGVYTSILAIVFSDGDTLLDAINISNLKENIWDRSQTYHDPSFTPYHATELLKDWL
jgi:hypothetical protein